MHAEAVVGQVVGVAQPREQVVRVQHRDLAHLAQPRPPRAHERIRADEDPERPAEAAHLADRLRPVVVEPEAVAVARDDRHRQVRREALAHRDRAAAGAAAAVRLRERLVQVDVDDVEAHVARPRDAADGVEVRAVVVHERAGGVEDVADRLDVLVEEAERRRVGEHQPGRVLVDLAAQVVEVDVAARVGADGRQLVAGHRHAGRVRAVRGVGDHDLAPLLTLAALVEVRAHQQQPGELALAAGGRLQADRVEARDLAQDLLEMPFELERALRRIVLDQRVQVAEARQPDESLVDARVVFHRAGAERIEARVDAEVARRELREVAHDLRLGQLREARRLAAGEFGRHGGHRQVRLRHAEPATARLRLLVDELHASASTSRSMSATVRRSVTATSSASSRPG